MDTNLPGNSKTPRGPAKQTKDKNLTKITTGDAVQRKRPLGKRFKENFFGGDARGAASLAASDVLLPALKNMLADAIRQATEQIIFGEVRSRAGSTFRGFTSGAYTAYAAQYSSKATPTGSRTPPWKQEADTRPYSQQARVTHNFNEILLETRADGEQVLDMLMTILQEYEAVSVSDLYQLVGIPDAYTDARYGWLNLQGAHVQPVHGGFLLNLPKPVPLN